MKSYLLKLLDVQPGEGTRVAILLLMSFFMGMFLATITVASQALFLNSFSEQEDLPVAFLLSGACGLLVTLAYNFLQNRIPFGWLGGLSLMVIVALTAFLEFGEGYFADERYLYFIGFALIIPFSFTTYLIFWGSFGRLFNTRQSKRLLGVVDVGAMIASFIAYFSIPQILDIKGVTPTTLFSISLFCIGAFLMLYLYLSTGYLNRQRSFSQERSFYRKMTWKTFFRNRYILFMSMFIILSMLVMKFVDYSFLTTTTQLLDAEQLAEFIAYFEMTVVIFNFLFQSFATDRIVSDYGMRVAMLINPILIGLFTVVAIFVGFSFGYSGTGGSAVVFFISIVMSKLFVASLRDALDNQTFRLYLLPIDNRSRIDVQTKIEGAVSAFAMVVAGALILLITKIETFDIIAISVATVPLVIGWYFVANRMHKGYQQTLHDTLAQNKERIAGSTEKGFTLSEVLERGANHSVEEKAIYALKLMENLEPAVFENAVMRLTSSPSDRIRNFALEKVSKLDIDRADGSTDLRRLAQNAARSSEDSDLLAIPEERLVIMGKSHRQADRVLAARLLRNKISTKTLFLLLELLRDSNPVVRTEALKTTRRIKRPETWSVLIELLGSPTFSHLAAAALKECGEQALPVLESAFHKSGQSATVMLRIVQIMGRIGGAYAKKLLWRKIDYPDKRIVKQILYWLRYINYQASGREAREVINLIETEIGKTLWNLTALHELPASEQFTWIRNALQEEVSDNYDQLTLLLSLLYDPQSIRLVRENLATGDPDSIAFAIELMDVFVDPELKPRLLPILDDSSVPLKLNHLQHFYPRESYNPIQVLNYVLNRDFNLSSRWAKACAIYTAAFIDEFRISRGLIAQVFNGDRLLQETAAWVIYLKDKNAYQSILYRLPSQDKKFVDAAIENNRLLDGLNDGFFLHIEITMLLKELPQFKGIHGNYICDLADKIIPLDLDRGEVSKVRDQELDRWIYIIAHGSVTATREDKTTVTLPRGTVYGDIFQDQDVVPVTSIEALERAVVFKLREMDFYFVMANHHELVDGLLKNVSKKQAVTDQNQ